MNTDINKVLIVHETTSGYWGFPKGGKKRSETMIQAAIRELREETGKIISSSRVSAIVSYRRHKLYVVVGSFPLQCRVDGREIDMYDWVTLTELSNMSISGFTRRCLKRAMYILPQAVSAPCTHNHRITPQPLCKPDHYTRANQPPALASEPCNSTAMSWRKPLPGQCRPILKTSHHSVRSNITSARKVLPHAIKRADTAVRPVSLSRRCGSNITTTTTSSARLAPPHTVECCT